MPCVGLIVEAEDAEKNKNKKLSEILGDSSPASSPINSKGPASQLSFSFFPLSNHQPLPRPQLSGDPDKQPRVHAHSLT